MSQELFYTSAPAGLKPGSSGFCTVAMTAGMSGILVQRLEMLSGYRELFPAGDVQSDQNPVAWSHWRISNGERTSSLFSRVCFAGMDYTHRANTFAHHIVIDTSEQCPAGPAWVMSQPGFMESTWDGSPRLFPRGRQVPIGEDAPRVCSAWEATSGDAGWAGMLAETVSSDIASIAYIIYRPGTDVLALVREAMALLPPRQRWLTTFSTYFTELPAGLTCSWRCCMAGTLAATEAHKYATSGVVIDLSKQLAAIVESPFVVAARTGGLSSSTRAIVPASLPTQDWRDQDWERIAPDTSERRLKSLKSLHDPTNNDGTRMPPRFPFVSEPDGGEGPEQAVKSSQPRTLFWIIAIVWPLLLIPGMVVWHLMSESQARHDLEMRVTTLNAQIQSDADSLSALRVATNDATSAKTKNEGETILKLSATTQMDVVELQEKDQELQNEKNRNDTLIKDHKTEIESVRNKDRADQAAAVAGVNQIAEQKVAAEKEKLETLAKSDEDLRGQFSAATTQPTFFWSGGLISAQPKILLNAPKNADYSYRQAGDEEIDISELSGREIASIVFADGYLKLVAKDTQAVARSSFHNWLQLASVRVHGEEQWADFQSCSLPILINDLGKTRVFPEFAGSVDQSHIQLRKAPLCDDKWQVIPSEDGLKCTFGQHNILLKYKNGKISRDDTPNGYAGTFPPLVVDLVYRYDTTEVILCRITITSPPSEQ